jgi:hypothetical protein
VAAVVEHGGGMAAVSLGGSNELGVEIVGRGAAVTISDHKRRLGDRGGDEATPQS